MPRFHLNVYNDEITLDDEGVVRSGIELAKAEAIRGARSLVAEHIIKGRPIFSSHRVEIADDAGHVLHIVSFGDIVDLRQ